MDNYIVINGVRHDYESLPPRVQVLVEAIGLTLGDRQDTYGSFTENMNVMGGFMQHLFYRQVNGHQAALTMMFAKLSRITINYPKVFHRDNYVDGVNYLAAAYEAEAMRAKGNSTPEAEKAVEAMAERFTAIAEGRLDDIYPDDGMPEVEAFEYTEATKNDLVL